MDNETAHNDGLWSGIAPVVVVIVLQNAQGSPQRQYSKHHTAVPPPAFFAKVFFRRLRLDLQGPERRNGGLRHFSQNVHKHMNSSNKYVPFPRTCTSVDKTLHLECLVLHLLCSPMDGCFYRHLPEWQIDFINGYSWKNPLCFPKNAEWHSDMNS